jgi:heptosyltransferase-1
VRILLVRTSAMGDIVHALPVLTALRRRIPEARLAWVVEQSLAPLLDGHPDLDRIITVDLRGWRKAPFSREARRGLFAAVRAMRAFAPDVAVDLMGNHKGGMLARLAGGRRTVGARRVDRREPSSAFWIGESVRVQGEHAVDRALSLLAAFDVSGERADFGSERLLATVPEAAVAWRAARKRPYVFIHPGAAWSNKRYPPSAWRAVAQGLRRTLGCDVVVGAAPGEEDLARAICTPDDATAELAPAPTLPHLAALLRGAEIVLGGDTGPLHLARALAVPTLFLMGPTDPRRHGPYGEPEGALAAVLPCSGCYRRFDDTRACLLAIPPAAVVAAATARLGEGAGRR